MQWLAFLEIQAKSEPRYYQSLKHSYEHHCNWKPLSVPFRFMVRNQARRSLFVVQCHCVELYYLPVTRCTSMLLPIKGEVWSRPLPLRKDNRHKEERERMRVTFAVVTLHCQCRCRQKHSWPALLITLSDTAGDLLGNYSTTHFYKSTTPFDSHPHHRMLFLIFISCLIKWLFFVVSY